MGCKALFIGGIKSGKSKNAEYYTLNLTKEKPIYLATNEFFDDEMKKRVSQHKKQREDNFETLEEPLHLYNIIKTTKKVVLVECVSMWINNMIYHGFDEQQIVDEIERVSMLENDIVFVINDVSCSVISTNKLTRKFVDINGRVAQIVAKNVDEVYNTVAGISIKIK